MRDSAGIEIIESYQPAWSQSAAWTVSPEPVLRLGTRDGPEPELRFTRIGGVTRLSDGRIVVLESSRPELRWFAADGQYEFTRGGRGSGPGEFNSVTAMVRMPGDRILVQDAPRTKQIIYNADGQVLLEEFLDFTKFRELGRWLECLTFTLPDRSIVGCQPEEGLQSGVPNRPGMLRQSSRFVRAPWDLSGQFALGVYRGIEQWGIDVGLDQLLYAVHPHYSTTVAAAGGDSIRIALAANPEYSVEIWSPEGTLERILRRPNSRKAIDAVSREQALESLRNTPFGVPDEYFQRMRSEIPQPDLLPAVARMAVDPEGALWIARPVLDEEEAVQIDVFAPSGELLGEIVLPPRFMLFEVGADYLLGIRRDVLGVPYVEQYAVSKP